MALCRRPTPSWPVEKHNLQKSIKHAGKVPDIIFFYFILSFEVGFIILENIIIIFRVFLKVVARVT